MSVTPWLPLAPTGVDEISAEDLERTRLNARGLWDRAQRGRRSMADQVTELYLEQQMPQRVFDGTALYRASWMSASSITLVIVCNLSASPVTLGASQQLDVQVNGTTRSLTTTVDGAQTITIALSACGLTDGDLIQVTVSNRFAVAPDVYPTPTQIRTAYITASPATALGTYTAPSTASGATVTAAQMNSLFTAQTYAAAWMRMLPEPLLLGMYQMPQEFFIGSWLLWRGVVTRENGDDLLRVTLGYTLVGSAGERVDLLVNGAVVATTGALSGTVSATWDITTSLAGFGVGTSVPVELTQVITADYASPAVAPRYSLRTMATEPASIAAVGTMTTSTRDELTTKGDVVARYNQVVAVQASIMSMLTTNTTRWQRVWLCRMPPWGDGYSYRSGYHQYAYPHRAPRDGDILETAGVNVSLNYGAITLMDAKAMADTPFGWTAARTEQLTGADGGKAITYLDTYGDCPRDQLLYVHGDLVQYAALRWIGEGEL